MFILFESFSQVYPCQIEVFQPTFSDSLEEVFILNKTCGKCNFSLYFCHGVRPTNTTSVERCLRVSEIK